ncbi:MAG: hypothetical protein LBG10_09885 [Treponema sp.]|nr:hypothetical protein [Treponema sp.]
MNKKKTPEKCISGPAGGENGVYAHKLSIRYGSSLWGSHRAAFMAQHAIPRAPWGAPEGSLRFHRRTRRRFFGRLFISKKLRIAAWGLIKVKNVQIAPFVPLCHVYAQQFGHFFG